MTQTTDRSNTPKRITLAALIEAVRGNTRLFEQPVTDGQPCNLFREAAALIRCPDGRWFVAGYGQEATLAGIDPSRSTCLTGVDRLADDVIGVSSVGGEIAEAAQIAAAQAAFTAKLPGPDQNKPARCFAPHQSMPCYRLVDLTQGTGVSIQQLPFFRSSSIQAIRATRVGDDQVSFTVVTNDGAFRCNPLEIANAVEKITKVSWTPIATEAGATAIDYLDMTKAGADEQTCFLAATLDGLRDGSRPVVGTERVAMASLLDMRPFGSDMAALALAGDGRILVVDKSGDDALTARAIGSASELTAPSDMAYSPATGKVVLAEWGTDPSGSAFLRQAEVQLAAAAE